jgi:hypothetical protein
MAALTQFSYTSTKKLRTASSVCGDVGFMAMPVAIADDAPDPDEMDPDRPLPPDAAADAVASGWCSSRNFVLLGVTKHDMYELKKRSMHLRYLGEGVRSAWVQSKVVYLFDLAMDGRPRRQPWAWGIARNTQGRASHNVHVAASPLHLLDNVQTRVHDELVHVARLVAEPRLAVAALLGRPKLMLEERVVLGADYDKVVGHVCGIVLVSVLSFACSYTLVSWREPDTGRR